MSKVSNFEMQFSPQQKTDDRFDRLINIYHNTLMKIESNAYSLSDIKLLLSLVEQIYLFYIKLMFFRPESKKELDRHYDEVMNIRTRIEERIKKGQSTVKINRNEITMINQFLSNCFQLAQMKGYFFYSKNIQDISTIAKELFVDMDKLDNFGDEE